MRVVPTTPRLDQLAPPRPGFQPGRIDHTLTQVLDPRVGAERVSTPGAVKANGVYSLGWDPAFRPLAAAETTVAHIATLGLARGQRLAQKWDPPKVWRSKEAEFAGLPDGEFPLLLPGLAIFRGDMARRLAGYVPSALRLPLVSEDGEDLELLQMGSLIDCLDVDRSRARRFSSGRVRSIDRAVLDGSRMGGREAIWRIPEAPHLLLVQGSNPILDALVDLPGLELQNFGEIV